TSCSRQVEIEYNPEKTFTVEDLRDDFSEFREKLDGLHPAINTYDNKALFRQIFDSAFSSIDQGSTLIEFYMALRRIASRTNCGHTRTWLPRKYWGKILENENHFPFTLYFDGSEAFIRHSYIQDSQIIPGNQVISINGTPMTEIIHNFLDIIAADGLNLTYKYHNMNQLSFGLFPGYPVFPDTYEIAYLSRDGGGLQNSTITALSYADIRKVRDELSLDFEESAPADMHIIDSLQTAVIRIGEFIAWDDFNFDDFYKQCFESIRIDAIQNIIIDVRGNDGGEPYAATDLISYIIDSSYTYFNPHVYGYSDLKRPIKPHSDNFQGNVFVLLDGGSFSTSGHFLSIIKHYNLGILIGEESGGSYRCNGCNTELVLPNTGIRVEYTRCVYSTVAKNMPKDRGIIPDYEINLSITDIIESNDPAMNLALELIGKDE
ncbi:MAG: hypothetical protein GY841_14245, partial [FCB group bacterium]|nr:hypothetical protein [FCB group bacterium]